MQRVDALIRTQKRDDWQAAPVLLDLRLGRQFTQALPRWHPQRR